MYVTNLSGTRLKCLKQCLIFKSNEWKSDYRSKLKCMLLID